MIDQQPTSRAPVVTVVGATGALGGHICEALLARGAKVRAMVRATSDRGFSATLAWVEVALTLVFFTSTILYLRPYKRRARAAAKAAPQKR